MKVKNLVIFSTILILLVLFSGCIEKSREESTTTLVDISDLKMGVDPILNYYLYYRYTYSFPGCFPDYEVYDVYSKGMNFNNNKNPDFVRTDYDKEHVLFLAYLNYGPNKLHQFIEVYDSEESAEDRMSKIINFAIYGWRSLASPEENSSHRSILNRDVLCGIVHTSGYPATWYVCQFRVNNTVIVIVDDKEIVYEFTEKLIRQIDESKTKKYPIILLPSTIKDYELLSYGVEYNRVGAHPRKIIEGMYLVEDKIIRARIEDWGENIDSWNNFISWHKNESYREIKEAKCIILNFTESYYYRPHYVYRCIFGNLTAGIYFPQNISFSRVSEVGETIIKKISSLNFQQGFTVSLETCEEKFSSHEKEDCIQYIAQERKNVQVCEKIQNQSIRDNCYLSLASVSPEICGKVNGDIQRDLCYYLGAEGRINSTFCKEIKDQTLRKRCYHEINSMEQTRVHP